MSKSRSRPKQRQKHQSKKQPQLTGAALTQQGRDAFEQGDYDRTIQLWEQARHKPDTPAKLPKALAEAYFRRAVSRPAPNLADLRQAVTLAPGDPYYRYHLALAQHRAGLLDEAETIYRQLLDESPPFERAAEPLAQLLVEQKKILNKDPVWDQISENTQTQLEVAEAIVRNKAASTLKRLAANESLHPIWQAMALLAAGDRAEARHSLQAALDTLNENAAVPRAVVHYYSGVLATDGNQFGQALAHWQTAQANGMHTRHLRENLGMLLYQQALAEHQAGRPTQALELLEQSGELRGRGVKRSDLYRQLNLEIGYTVSRQGKWQQALSHWEEAERIGDDSRRLLMNLALAYQHVEQYFEAAERWRALLRRRPRKADHPDALTDDQVARMWQNVAENYSKAGDYEEAIKTYKNAVKWAPDNLNLRLKLVEALQAEGRWQAATNELERILDKNPDHVPALTLLAEIYSGEFWTHHQAEQLWRRVLDLEPENPIARQQLAYLYEKEGTFASRWGQHREALEIYKKGLAAVPDNQRLHVVIGGTYAELGDLDQARHYFKEALALNPNDLQTLHAIFMVWLEFGSETDLKQAFDHIKEVKTSIPSNFFFDLIDRCLMAEDYEQAENLLEYTRTRYSTTESDLLELALRYIQLEEDGTAVSILRQILQDNPENGDASLRLGSLYYKLGQTRLAHRYFDKAEAIAHKEKDQMLLYELKTAKDYLIHGKQPPRTPLEMLRGMPPELRKQMLDQLPPHIADLLQGLDPEMLDMMLDLEFMDDFDDDEEDDYYYV